MTDREDRVLNVNQVNRLQRWTSPWRVAAFAALFNLMGAAPSLAQELPRKVLAKTAPTYPELAKRMHLAGKVKLEIVITSAGSVASAKLIGGSPIFERNAIEAVKQWKFERGDKETKAVVFLEFVGGQP